MRVSKTVREYIEKKVGEIYSMELNEIENELENLNKENNEKVANKRKEIETVIRSMLENDFKSTSSWNDKFSLSLYIMSTEIESKRKELELRRLELHRIKNETISNIVVELELGGTRDTLEKLLAQALEDYRG